MHVPAAEADFDAGDAGFDQFAGQEATAAEVVCSGASGTVLFLQLRVDRLAIGLFIEAEDLFAARHDEANGLVVNFLVSLSSVHHRLLVRARLNETAFEALEDGGAAHRAALVHCRLDVLWRLAGILDGERRILHAEEARTQLSAADRDEGRDVRGLGGFRVHALEERQNRAERRVVENRATLPASVHDERAASVVAFGRIQ